MFEEEEELAEGDESEAMRQEQDSRFFNQTDENVEEQMDYYVQQHPELLLALDIAAFRRQQMQERL